VKQDKLKAASESDQPASNQYWRASEQITRALFQRATMHKSVEKGGRGFEKTLSRITGAREKFAEEIGKAGDAARGFGKDSQVGLADLTVKAKIGRSEQPEGRAGSVADFPFDRSGAATRETGATALAAARSPRRGCNRTRLEGL